MTAATVGHSTNLVGVPTGLLASAAFNDYPLPLHINGVRETNRALWEMLGQSRGAEDAALAFATYMNAVFGLEEARPEDRPRRYRASYLRLLAGWGFDANRAEGAVLKGWVESRFGLTPTYHREKLARVGSEPWVRYLEEKMGSRFHNNSINLQLDLLYEFCQWSLPRNFFPGRRHLRLYRGVNDFDEHEVVDRDERRRCLVRQNNLVSFSADRDVAGQFGDWILEAQVPLAKVLFFTGLLPRHPLKGEGEFLVIGGQYRMKVAYA